MTVPVQSCGRAWNSRLLGFGLSLGLHLLGLFGAAWLDSGGGTAEARSARRDAVEEIVLTPKDKIIWYDFRQPLPDVAPSEMSKPAAPTAPLPAKESPILVSAPPIASPAAQTVLQPDPKPLEQEVKAPNIVGFRPPPPPPPPRREAPAESQLLEAPQVAVARLAVSPSAVGESSTRVDAAKPPVKKFMPGNALAASSASSSSPELAAAPVLTAASADVGPLNAAIVSLRPADRLEALPPEGSRRGQFGTAAEQGPLSAGGSAPGLRLPGIASRNSVPPPAASAAPVEPAGPALKLPGTVFSFSAPLHPSSRRLPREVEERFATRPAYTVVVPRPPLAQYAGDWVIWFAETHPAEGPAPLIRAPMPHIWNGAATSGAANGSARPSGSDVTLAAVLGVDGILSKLVALSSRTPELASKAVSDLNQWRLHPARRKGEAVEVEVVLLVGFQ